MNQIECYHCSQPIDGDHQYINDGGGASYHPRCYADAARNDSCIECGGLGPDVFVVTTGGILATIHAACAKSRAQRLAFK